MIGNRAYARKFDAIGTKPCKVCRNSFEPRNSLQRVCGPVCALRLAGSRRLKKLEVARRTRRRAERESLMTRSDWLRRAQVAFNRWVRLRDANQPCISCPTTEAKWDAGHYRSVGACPELRFEPDNCFKQCARCNSWKSGNAIDYRIGLVKRIGVERVGWLEGPHEPKRYSIEEIREIEREYKRLAKELVRQSAPINYGGTG